MSVGDLIKKFEAEKDGINAKIAALKERDEFLGNLLEELRSVDGARAKAPAPASSASPKAAGKEKRGRKRKGGMTVRDAIMKTVAGASAPLRAGEIIEKAVALSGGAETSVRTQINGLTKSGDLKQVAFAGRGFKYELGNLSKSAEVAASAAEPGKAAKPKK